MHKVFLVEDEIVVREGIRNSIPWDETPFLLAGEAPDGEMALKLINEIRPDILITDIRMPFLDGLGLARIIKKTQPRIKIIILSGHDEFQYAKEAISIGIEEYLLKPVSPAELMKVLNRVSSKIEIEKERLTNMENLRHQALSAAEIRRERWLCDLTAGALPSDRAWEQSQEMGYDLTAKGYQIVVIGIDTDSDRSSNLLLARGMIKNILLERTDVIFFSLGAEKIVLIIKQLSEERSEGSVSPLVSILEEKVGEETDCRLIMGIGQRVEHLEDIPLSYASACAKLNQPSDAPFRPLKEPSVLIDTIPPKGNLISDRLKYASLEDVDEIMNCYIEILKETPDHSPFICNYLLGDIIVAATEIINDLEEDIRNIVPEILGKDNIDHICRSYDSFYSHLRTLVEKTIRFKMSQKRYKHHNIIWKAKDFIDGHYADPDISLNMVADHVNISPNHFSTIYSQETGQNFIEYLTSVRIEKAKQLLLTTDLKNSEIAAKSGFSDPHYFSFIFKKNVGISPRAFKSKGN